MTNPTDTTNPKAATALPDADLETGLGAGCEIKGYFNREGAAPELRERFAALQAEFANLQSRWCIAEGERLDLRAELAKRFDPKKFRLLKTVGEGILAIIQDELDLRPKLIAWIEDRRAALGDDAEQARQAMEEAQGRILKGLLALGFTEDDLRPYLKETGDAWSRVSSLADAHPEVRAAKARFTELSSISENSILWKSSDPNSPQAENAARCRQLTEVMRRAIARA